MELLVLLLVVGIINDNGSHRDALVVVVAVVVLVMVVGLVRNITTCVLGVCNYQLMWTTSLNNQKPTGLVLQ